MFKLLTSMKLVFESHLLVSDSIMMCTLAKLRRSTSTRVFTTTGTIKDVSNSSKYLLLIRESERSRKPIGSR